jgi:hypothetical protein
MTRGGWIARESSPSTLASPRNMRPRSAGAWSPDVRSERRQRALRPPYPFTQSTCSSVNEARGSGAACSDSSVFVPSTSGSTSPPPSRFGCDSLRRTVRGACAPEPSWQPFSRRPRPVSRHDFCRWSRLRPRCTLTWSRTRRTSYRLVAPSSWSWKPTCSRPFCREARSRSSTCTASWCSVSASFRVDPFGKTPVTRSRQGVHVDVQFMDVEELYGGQCESQARGDR